MVTGQRGPVSIIEGNLTAQVLKVVHILKDLVSRPELHPCYYLISDGRYMAVILIFPSLEYFSAEVYFRYCLTGYKNAALIEMKVGNRKLFEDQNGVLQVLSDSMHTEIGAAGCASWIYLNQAVD